MEKAVGNKPIFRDKKRRVWELDFLRGIAVIAMCFDHMMFDFAYFRSWFSNGYEIENSFMSAISAFAKDYWATGSVYDTGFRFWAHYLFVFLFLFLVGISCALSRNNTKRGSLLGIVAIAFTGATFGVKALGIMDSEIIFGILHCIALSILCAAAVESLTKWNEQVNKFALFGVGIIIIAVGIANRFWNMALHYDRVFVDEHFLGYIFGTHAYGEDWFGLMPYMGVVMLGMYWGKAVYNNRASLLPVLDGKWNKPFNFVGRHALLFYLAHQVIIAGVVVGICLCMGYRL